MKKFFGRVLAGITAIVLFLGILVALIGIAVSSQEDEVEMEDETVMLLKLDKPIKEVANNSPFDEIDLPIVSSESVISLQQIRKALAEAKEDERIKGVYLELDKLRAGLATIEEIRNSILDFKESGKWVVAYADIYSEPAYYLASAADEIYANPLGDIEFNGLFTQISFFKGTLEKLDVEPEVFRVGDFKSAVEPFLRSEMSEENRLQISEFLNGFYTHMMQNISAARDIPENRLRMIADSLMVSQPVDAKKLGLITDIMYADQIQERLKVLTFGEVDEEEDEEEEDLPFITPAKYDKVEKSFLKAVTKTDKIAVIVGQGEIVMEGDQDQIVGNKLAEQIREARKDENVKAIVLRINSPGGSALASDIMWREINLAKQSKPLIASMGDVAASGGYYMAMAADTIVASPMTITGSIGVFGLFFNLKETMNKNLGVTFDMVKTGEMAGIGNPFNEITDKERKFIQNSVEAIYDTFTTKVAMGRDMTVARVKEIGGGRVYTGIDAQKIDLVDVLGTIDDAIEIAANSAGLKKGEYRIKYLPEKKDFFETLTKSISENAKASLSSTNNYVIDQMIDQMRQLERFRGIQTRMPYDMIID